MKLWCILLNLISLQKVEKFFDLKDSIYLISINDALVKSKVFEYGNKNVKYFNTCQCYLILFRKYMYNQNLELSYIFITNQCYNKI